MSDLLQVKHGPLYVGSSNNQPNIKPKDQPDLRYQMVERLMYTILARHRYKTEYIIDTEHDETFHYPVTFIKPVINQNSVINAQTLYFHIIPPYRLNVVNKVNIVDVVEKKAIKLNEDYDEFMEWINDQLAYVEHVLKQEEII